MTTVRRRRLRRVIKWGGLGLSLVIAAMWAASRWWRLEYCTGDARQGFTVYEVAWGCFCFVRIESTSRFTLGGGWHLVRQRSPRGFVWELVTIGGLHFVPLWIFFLLVAIPTVFLFWLDRRRIPPGHCQKCGYDLNGNTSGVCPECGLANRGLEDR